MYNFVKLWPILIIFGLQHREETYVSDYSFAHLTFILLLQYLVKFRSQSLADYSIEFLRCGVCL